MGQRLRKDSDVQKSGLARRGAPFPVPGAAKMNHASETIQGLRFRQSHIWWGVSVGDRQHSLPRINHLQAAPASVRFLSVEPLLEDLGELDLTGIHWVIVGGESGAGARPSGWTQFAGGVFHSPVGDPSGWWTGRLINFCRRDFDESDARLRLAVKMEDLPME